MNGVRDRLIRRLVLLIALPLAILFARVLVRDGVQLETDVVYGQPDGHRLLLDVYRPRGAEEHRPAVILIHGGGWRGGRKADNRAFATQLARAGFVAFAIDYRLTRPTSDHYPAQLDDVQRAVRWVRAHADRYGIDPARVGAFGHSAGGHLAALLGTRETRDNRDPVLASYSSRVACVVDTSGPTDFTDPAHPPLFPALMHLVPEWLGKTREEAPELYRDASPLAHVSRDSAPFLILHGTRDDSVPLEQSRRLYEALRQVGVEATLITVDDGHLFQEPRNQARWLSETEAFLRRHLTEFRTSTDGR